MATTSTGKGAAKTTPDRTDAWEAAVLAMRADPARQDLVRESYYDDPLAAAAARYHASGEWAAVRKWLPSGAGRTALDVGAGRGIVSYALAADGYQVTALEPDPSAVVGAAAIRAMAADAQLPITVIQSASEQIPAPDRAFDVVIARAVLHHVADLPGTMAEVFRVLKPGGRFLGLREHVISRPEDLDAFLDAHALHRDYGGENALLLGDYLAAIRGAGLQTTATLAPIASEINFAPYTVESARAQIARRAGPLAGPVRALLSTPLGWGAALPLLTRFDHRPGRHYSFVATKPE